MTTVNWGATQILNLLPYYVSEAERREYHDPDVLLQTGLRQCWWKNYGALTGRQYGSLPADLARDDLVEITAQPLLNYLVALSFNRGKLDFSQNVNLNEIYADLVAAVHERGYEKKRPYAQIRHISLDNFTRVLEEIGLAAWHGDGRTTTVGEIEEHCRTSGVVRLLDAFQEGAKAGVTRFLLAFFFRQYGQRSSGDPTFVFTHKSFGEYLTAKRIVRAIGRITRERSQHEKNPDAGWNERDALKHWMQVCGPSAMTRYLHSFVVAEFRLREEEEAAQWQNCFADLFSFVLRHGMPMEQLQLNTFKTTMFQSRNAEEALLVIMNACALRAKKTTPIVHPNPTAFGGWLYRIQGQRSSAESALALDCLSLVDLAHVSLALHDLFSANLREAHLEGAYLGRAHLGEAHLEEAHLERAYLGRANLEGAHLEGAHLEEANLRGAYLVTANLEGAHLEGAHLEGANLEGAYLEGVIR